MRPSCIFIGEAGGEAGISTVEMAKAIFPSDEILAGDANGIGAWLSSFLGVKTILTPRTDAGNADDYLSIILPVLDRGGVLAPSTEWDIQVVQRHLPQRYLPSQETIDLITDKLPPGDDFFSDYGIKQIPTYPSHPHPGSVYIAKPRRGAGSKGIVMVTDRVHSPTDYVYQPCIDVDYEVVVDILFDRDLLVYLPRKVFCIKGGNDIAVQLVGADDPDFMSFHGHIASVGRKIGYRGIGNFQYLVDKDDQAWFLEANPRLSGFSRVWLSEGINPLEPFLDWIAGRQVRQYGLEHNRSYYRMYQHRRISQNRK